MLFYIKRIKRTKLLFFFFVGNSYFKKPPKNDIINAIKSTEAILKKSGNFCDFEQVLRARTPILKTFCSAENIDCDLSFSNGLSFCNTILINYFLNLQPVARKLTTFIKYWSQLCNLGVNSYVIVLLVIFYLQNCKLLPSLHHLQRTLEPILIDGRKF